MQHPLRLSLSLAGIAALALASIPFGISPAAAQDSEVPGTEAAGLGVMGVNLRDAVKFNYGFQGALQGAGTPNQAGIGAFVPLHVSSNSVAFVDVLVNANFNDYGNNSSIINTTVAGTTFSSSTRLGYRWLNGNRSWMFGVNAGYDSRPMATGPADTGVTVTNSQTVFFQQVAASLEAVSNSWNFNAYALVPVGDTEQQLNSFYQGGALDTYGLDVGYSITPDLKASVGYYYQYGDLNTADGSGVNVRLAYNLTNGLTVGANLSYDQAFETRVSADLKYRFGTNGYGAPSIRKQQPVVMPVIQSLTATPSNRDVRVHDKASSDCAFIRTADESTAQLYQERGNGNGCFYYNTLCPTYAATAGNPDNPNVCALYVYPSTGFTTYSPTATSNPNGWVPAIGCQAPPPAGYGAKQGSQC